MKTLIMAPGGGRHVVGGDEGGAALVLRSA
jgi:hypothetical protein